MTEDFDGCHRACRVKAAHSLIWGGCEHAIPPEPTVSMSMVYTDSEDGYPSIGFDAYTVAELGELITAGLRASDLPVNGDDLVDVGLVAAHAIIHRNDKPKERQSVTDQPTAEVQLAAARATNRRLNLRAQQLESELATYRRAISTWEFTDRGTYVPLRSITAMAKAAGVGYDATRYELHYERVERDEAQLTAIADLIADHEGDEWAAHPATAALRRILDGQAPAAAETEPNNPRTTVDNPATSSDPHIYLSTGCYHGDHAYCQNMTGLNGAKRPASCKKCGARCICPCHQQTEPPVHIGGGANAEDCPACTGTNPPYPFICPGPDAEQPVRTTVKNPADA